jgi:hypothetical protein
MKINFSNVQRLLLISVKDCLKNRQSWVVIVAFSLISISCGKVINKKKDLEAFDKNISFLLMERECIVQNTTESAIAKSIRELFQSAVQKAPQDFYLIAPRLYDYQNPLILSQAFMNKGYLSLKDDSGKNPEELYYLFNGSRRFEDQKCYFDNLAAKKKYDLRPYLNIANHNPKNTEKDNAIELCKSFSKEVNCQAEYIINQKNKTVATMIERYFSRFQDERFTPLFKLRPTHLKFNCQKIDANKTVMNIKVLDSSIPHSRLVELLAFVSETWTHQKFELKLELVKNYADGVVVIVPTNKGISYVPDSNNRMVYLSASLDLATTKRVLAHEFGHVLGFPDCYIEFFDDSKKELVYYEISKENTNIMCSLKEGVGVDDDYFTQLAQNSCL